MTDNSKLPIVEESRAAKSSSSFVNSPAGHAMREAADTIESAAVVIEGLLKSHTGGERRFKGQCCFEADAGIDFLAKIRGDQ